jgi:hypothetical protein
MLLLLLRRLTALWLRASRVLASCSLPAYLTTGGRGVVCFLCSFPCCCCCCCCFAQVDSTVAEGFEGVGELFPAGLFDNGRPAWCAPPAGAHVAAAAAAACRRLTALWLRVSRVSGSCSLPAYSTTGCAPSATTHVPVAGAAAALRRLTALWLRASRVLASCSLLAFLTPA